MSDLCLSDHYKECQKNYDMIKQCLTEYEESVNVKSHVHVILSAWLPTDIVHHILSDYLDTMHTKFLGYMAEAVEYGRVKYFKTTYETITYSLQQHELLKQWVEKMPPSAAKVNCYCLI